MISLFFISPRKALSGPGMACLVPRRTSVKPNLEGEVAKQATKNTKDMQGLPGASREAIKKGC